MNSKRLIELTLALVLWYFLAGLVFERVLGVLPAGYASEAFFLAGAALPWSALLLGFLEPAHSPFGAIVQQALFLFLTACGIALNAWLLDQVLLRGWRLAREQAALARRRRLRRPQPSPGVDAAPTQGPMAPMPKRFPLSAPAGKPR